MDDVIMNGILFSDGNKNILFDITDYEFIYCKKMDYYDANWLTVNIRCTDNCTDKSYKDNCILTYELDNLVKQIDNIIDGKESGLITEFMEPYLKFSITKTKDIYAVQIRFVCDTTEEWKEVYVSQGMNVKELVEMRNGLDKLRKKFPVRQVK